MVILTLHTFKSNETQVFLEGRTRLKGARQDTKKEIAKD